MTYVVRLFTFRIEKLWFDSQNHNEICLLSNLFSLSIVRTEPLSEPNYWARFGQYQKVGPVRLVQLGGAVRHTPIFYAMDLYIAEFLIVKGANVNKRDIGR